VVGGAVVGGAVGVVMIVGPLRCGDAERRSTPPPVVDAPSGSRGRAGVSTGRGGLDGGGIG
ncbi:hypothetical protein, partial [Microbacterium sp. ZOR0019]|uniref:hypothetical protein n=1 Tax=Microbacterium sp. ZOR0019 TaxID=1339233 RepID=UPI001E6344AB